MVPGVPDQAWRQVAVTARECLGAGRCPFGIQCYSERARRMAAESDVIVTNHALLAIDTLGEGGILPEHRVVIVDEAHELVDRVTSVATGELSGYAIDFAVRRTGKLADDGEIARLSEAGNALTPLLATMPAGRMDHLDQGLGATLAALRDAATACAAQVRKIAGTKDEDADPAEVTAAQTALVSLEEIAVVADRMISAFDQPIAEREEVVWLERPEDWSDSTRPASLHVAPLEVGEVLAEHLFADKTVVLTSATLTLGGSFTPLARQWGLDAAAMGHEWTGIDVGSPFAHGRSGILYVAKHLPPPSRDGLPPEYMDELWELIKAAGGRTLGLFSSMRAAQGGGRRDARVAALPGALPGRRLHHAAGEGVRRRRADLPVRHAVAVAGGGRARALAAARGHRPDPVPPAGRPARLGPHQGGGRARRVRASWRCRRTTPPCCSRRGRGGCCGPWTTGASSPCSTPGSSPSGTGSTCGRRCRRSGRRPTRGGPRRAASGSRPAERVATASGQLERVEHVPFPQAHRGLFRIGPDVRLQVVDARRPVLGAVRRPAGARRRRRSSSHSRRIRSPSAVNSAGGSAPVSIGPMPSL